MPIARRPSALPAAASEGPEREACSGESLLPVMAAVAAAFLAVGIALPVLPLGAKAEA